MSKDLSKLQKILDVEGFENLDALLEDVIMDTVCPGICANPGCSYTCEIEPDQERGWCELCATNTVKSALVLAQLI